MINYQSISQDEYNDTLSLLIKLTESLHSVSTNVGDAKATIGWGYTFNRNNNVEIWTRSGLTLTNAEQTLLARIDAAPNARKTELGLQFRRTMNAVDSDALLVATIPEYEGPANTLSLPLSLERLAFVSLTYNRGVGTVNRRMGEFFGAINDGNRAEAWFRMRYNSFGSDPRFVNGLAKRRYLESSIFGLYDSAIPTAAEVNTTFQMVTKHRDEIASYEAKYGVTVDGRAGIRNMIAVGNADASYRTIIAHTGTGQIQNIIQSLEVAKNALLEKLRSDHPELIGKLGNGAFLSSNVYLAGGSAGRNIDARPFEKFYQSGIANDLIVGNEEINHLLGRKGSDTIFGLDGIDFIGGGADSDILVGGHGNDLLYGGDGDDTYVYNIGDGQDTIIDYALDAQGGDGKGKIVVGTTTLTGTDEKSYIDEISKHQTWKSADEKFVFTLIDGDLKKGGTLEITGEGIGADGKITVRNFKQETLLPGALGIKLNLEKAIAITPDSSNQNPINSSSYTDEARSVDINELGAKLTKVFLNGPAKAGDTLRLAGSGDLAIVTGADTISLADGDAVLQLTEGQTEISFAVLNRAAISADETVSLSATLVEANPGGAAAASDTLTINLHDNGQTDAQTIQTSRTILGDLHPVDPARTDDLGNVVTDGQAAPGRADLLFDSADNDQILSGGGNDYVDAIRGGDDIIHVGAGDDQANGGAGNDQIQGEAGRDVLRGQLGNDVLEGGADADIIYGHEGNDSLYGGEKIALDAAITQGASGTGGSGQGDFLQGMDGNDTVIGTDRNDLVAGGSGDDNLVGAQGDDFIVGDATYDAFTKDWNVSIQVDGNTTTYTVNGASLIPGAGGDDVIHAGAGNDGVLAGDGNDLVYAEAGDDKVWGDAGNDVLLGGDGNDQLSGDNGLQFLAESLHGDDFIDGGAGDDNLFGNGGNDELFGGSGNDNIYGDTTEQAQGGDDYLDGEDGDDTLVGVGGNDVIFGGDGNDVLAGDSSDTLEAQQGDDTLYGEAGDDELQGNRGNDYLDGGAGADLLIGGRGEDQLLGGDGNDELSGDDGSDDLDGGEADYLDGGAGDDTVFGQGGDDVLIGGAGDDGLVGGAGNDQADGGDGNDLLFGEAGDDVLAGGVGADQADGGAGDDSISGGDDNDLLLGGDGNDTLSGDGGDDQLQGGTGDDSLQGGDGVNTLFGEDGNDTLIGGSSRDYLLGGAGDDNLSGGDGDDVYYYNLGEGEDHIDDSAGTDWLVLGNGITASAVRLDVGSLRLVFADGGSVHLDDFDPDNPLAGAIEYFQFSDGVVMSRQQLIQTLGFKLEGTPDQDSLSGTALNDTIHAYANDDEVLGGGGNDTIDLGSGDDQGSGGDGNDTVIGGDGLDTLYGDAGDDWLDGGNGDDLLFGGDGADHLLGGVGDDILAGGGGDDLLEGGDGHDVYQFGVGDGQDVVIDHLGNNAIQLTGGLNEAQINLRRQDLNLLLTIPGTSDQLTIKDWFAVSTNDWALVLGDGTVLDRAAVADRLARNQAPVVVQDAVTLAEDGLVQAGGNALANDYDPEGHALRVTNSGILTGNYGVLNLNADGAFNYALNNNSAAVQSLAAGQSVTERFGYTATDDDPNGAASAQSAIVVTINGTNDAPVVLADSAQVTEDGVLSASGNVLGNDHDVDVGTVLRVNAPGIFNGTYGSLALGADGAYAYTLNNNAAAVQGLGRNQNVVDHFNYTVSDGIANVASALDVHVTGKNDAPLLTVPLPDQNASANSAYAWQVPSGSFIDVDTTDVLGYQATQADGSALPSWLAFNAATRTFSGRVPRTATGYLDIKLTATDRVAGSTDTSGSLAVSDVFRLTFAASSGGGGGGGSHGNEGVGNGIDGPPNGHDDSFNDGVGTAPGSPGAKGGNGPGHRNLTAHDDLSHGPQIHASVLTAQPSHAGKVQQGLVHGNNDGPQKGGQRTLTQQDVTSAGLHAAAVSGSDGSAGSAGKVTASLAGVLPQVARFDPRTEVALASDQGNAEATVFAKWAALDARLATHLAQADARVAGADIQEGRFNGLGHGLGANIQAVRDPLAVSASAGTRLGTLRGLQDGFTQLSLA